MCSGVVIKSNMESFKNQSRKYKCNVIKKRYKNTYNTIIPICRKLKYIHSLYLLIRAHFDCY